IGPQKAHRAVTQTQESFGERRDAPSRHLKNLQAGLSSERRQVRKGEDHHSRRFSRSQALRGHFKAWKSVLDSGNDVGEALSQNAALGNSESRQNEVREGTRHRETPVIGAGVENNGFDARQAGKLAIRIAGEGKMPRVGKHLLYTCDYTGAFRALTGTCQGNKNAICSEAGCQARYFLL